MADLITDCMRSNPDRRPSSKEVFELLRSGGTKHRNIGDFLRGFPSGDHSAYMGGHPAASAHLGKSSGPVRPMGNQGGMLLDRPVASMQIERPHDTAFLTRPLASMQLSGQRSSTDSNRRLFTGTSSSSAKGQEGGPWAGMGSKVSSLDGYRPSGGTQKEVQKQAMATWLGGRTEPHGLDPVMEMRSHLSGGSSPINPPMAAPEDLDSNPFAAAVN